MDKEINKFYQDLTENMIRLSNRLYALNAFTKMDEETHPLNREVSLKDKAVCPRIHTLGSTLS